VFWSVAPITKHNPKIIRHIVILYPASNAITSAEKIASEVETAPPDK